jgi:ribonuclease HII
MLISSYTKQLIEAGCDEAGRGSLAGPVFAAAVILPLDFRNSMLNDSKQISEKKRLLLRDIIKKEAIDWSVESIDKEGIDSLNILWASVECMHKALRKLKTQPQLILVDGNRFKEYRNSSGYTIEYKCCIKGDATYASIAAASILAKTYRDDYMRGMALKYPQYGWDHNVGYPTHEHREAIRKYGVTPLHRETFKLLPDPELFI